LGERWPKVIDFLFGALFSPILKRRSSSAEFLKNRCYGGVPSETQENKGNVG
jgi:hypothetical protein